MRTKFHIIAGTTTHEISTTDIKNWDEVKFTLERKDYSGVTRTFSSQFEFVGEAYSLLRDMYLSDGFLASASVAVSTKNNDWTYTEQFRCPLDFSTIEIADGVLTNTEGFTQQLNSIDVAATMNKVNQTLTNVQQMTDALNSKEGTLGLLMHDPQLYNNLNATMSDADKLMIDFREHPKRYIHFSVFGKKDK